MTTVYLIRHSVKFDPKCIDIYNTDDNKQTKTEKKMLSVEGEKRAELLSEEDEFKDIDLVYSSDYVRAMQTAKYFLKDGLKLNIDKRFNERTLGIVDKEKHPNYFCEQYLDERLKMPEGESQEEVRKRITEAFYEVVNNNKDKRIIIVSHGTAISFLLMNWCKLLDVKPNLLRKLEFNNKIVIDRVYKAPEVFKVTLDNDKIIDIENLEFENIN